MRSAIIEAVLEFDDFEYKEAPWDSLVDIVNRAESLHAIAEEVRQVMKADSEPPPPVGHTCLAIDKLHTEIGNLYSLTRPSAAADWTSIDAWHLLDQVRDENIALRARLAWFEKEHRRLTGGRG